MTKEQASSIAKAMLAPHNIGQLKKAIEHMRDDLLVFNFTYGDIEGCSSWKRKETWKQYCRRIKNEKKQNPKWI